VPCKHCERGLIPRVSTKIQMEIGYVDKCMWCGSRRIKKWDEYIRFDGFLVKSGFCSDRCKMARGNFPELDDPNDIQAHRTWRMSDGPVLE